MALKHRNTQPLLIPLTHEDSGPWGARRITVHLAISDSELERNALSLLGRNARFSVVKGSIGYAAEADVRIIDQPPDPDQTRALDELKPPRLLFLGGVESDAMRLEAARAGAWAFVAVSTDAKTLEATISTLAESAGSPLLMQLASSNAGSEAVPETRRPLGRPSRKGEIESAWEQFLKAKEINFDAPQINAIRKVRLEVLRISPSKVDNGLGNEAIRRIISKKFQAENHKRNKGP